MSWRIAAKSVSEGGHVEALERIDLEDSERYNEDWLQDVLDKHPDLVPLSPLHCVEGPLISLGREIDTRSGPIDNLFVSPGGMLVVVEVKLWRNSESRRKVIAQILSYSEALSRMTFEDLDSRVRGTIGGPSIWERVAAAAPGRTDESAFVDTVVHNLANARFILLVVGDGIRGDLAELTELLTSQIGMAFELDLIEIQMYRLPGGQGGQDRTLLVPHIVGKTSIVERIVVTNAFEDSAGRAGRVDITRAPNNDQTELDAFFCRIAQNLSRDEFDRTRELFDWWNRLDRSATEAKKTGVWLTVSSPSGPVDAFWIGDRGIGEIRLAELQEKHHLTAELRDEFEGAGFVVPRKKANPQRELALADDASYELLQSLLEKLAICLTSAETSSDHQ